MLGFLGSLSRGYSSSKKTISEKIAEKFATFSKGKINNIPKVNRSNIGVNFDYGLDAIASSNNFDKDFNKHRDRLADDYAQKVESFASQTVNNDRTLSPKEIAEQEKASFKDFFDSLKGDYQDYKKCQEALLENSSKIDNERKSQPFNHSYTRSQTPEKFTSPHHLNPDPTPHKTKPAQPGIFSYFDESWNGFVADVNQAAALREAQERQKAQEEARQRRAEEAAQKAADEAAAKAAAAAASAAAAQQAVKEEQLNPVFFGHAANSHQASGNKRPADNNDPKKSKKQKTEEFNFGNIFPLPFSLPDLFQASPTPASSPQASSPRANSSSTNSSPASSTFSWSNPFLASPTPANSSPANSSSANSSSANSSSANSSPANSSPANSSSTNSSPANSSPANSPLPWGGVENLFNPTSWFGAQNSAEKSSPSPETRSPVSPSPVGPSSGSSLRPSATNSPASLTTSQSCFGESIFASPSAGSSSGSSSGSSNSVYSNTPSFDGRQVSKIVDALKTPSITPESTGPKQLTFDRNNNGQIKLSDGFILTLQGNKVSTIAKGATNKWYNPQFFQKNSANKEIQVKGNGDIAFSHSGNSYSLPKSQIDKAIMSQGGGKSPAVGARGPGSSGRSR